MLITFKTLARYPNITMFGDVAIQLLKLMGRRETVPSAMEPEDIPHALERLRAGLIVEAARHEDEPVELDEDEDEEPAVAIATRAMPLIELLEAALKENAAVIWEEGGQLP